jgi:hypothetical protein
MEMGNEKEKLESTGSSMDGKDKDTTKRLSERY